MMFLANSAKGHAVSNGYLSDDSIPKSSTMMDGPRQDLPASQRIDPALPYQALSEGVAKQLVQVFKLLADETRLKIISYLLQAGELNVRSLCRLLKQSQPAVSHHLALMKACGLIDSRRDGKNNFYRVMPDQFGHFAEVLFSQVPGVEQDIINMGVTSIRLEREVEPSVAMT